MVLYFYCSIVKWNKKNEKKKKLNVQEKQILYTNDKIQQRNNERYIQQRITPKQELKEEVLSTQYQHYQRQKVTF